MNIVEIKNIDYIRSEHLISQLKSTLGMEIEDIKTKLMNSDFLLSEEEKKLLDSDQLKLVEYFWKYTSILKMKCMELLNMIEKISTKDTKSIISQLKEFDISIDKNGNIRSEDAIRIMIAMLTNFHELCHMKKFASLSSTYYIYQLKDMKPYPNLQLQVWDLSNDEDKGNISLSDRQKKKIQSGLKKKKYIQ